MFEYPRFLASRLRAFCSFDSSLSLFSLPRGIKGKPFHMIGLGASARVGELGALHVGEVGAVIQVGEVGVGVACEIASMASTFSVSIHENSSCDNPLGSMEEVVLGDFHTKPKCYFLK
jgi:hypothetical protein